MIEDPRSLVESRLESQFLHCWSKFFKGHFVAQKWFGNKRVDFYIPAPHRIVIEVDGSQHFERPNFNNDISRDESLLDDFSINAIVRIPASSLKSMDPDLTIALIAQKFPSLFTEHKLDVLKMKCKWVTQPYDTTLATHWGETSKPNIEIQEVYEIHVRTNEEKSSWCLYKFQNQSPRYRNTKTKQEWAGDCLR